MSDRDTPSKYLRVLEKRANFLSDRVARSPRDLSFDKAERQALRWAIRMLNILMEDTVMAKNCMTKGCPRLSVHVGRGMCLVCYSRAKKLVESGQATWSGLVEMGLALPETDGGADPFTKAFNEAVRKQKAAVQDCEPEYDPNTQLGKDMATGEYGAPCDPKRFGE